MEVTTRIYDIENDGALLFEKTVVDTAEAEDLDTGTTVRRRVSSTSLRTLHCCCTITIRGIAAGFVNHLDNAEVFQYESAIDDFDDNKVKGWEKFDFGTGNGFFKEKGGQFTIGMQSPPGSGFLSRPLTRKRPSPLRMASRSSSVWT